ncbi:hypothetical protein EN766_24030 [Mesorhizobium sp. M2A.F.Ca.ET.046.02.1.1]|nr:hypothetical protein EN766_24030 [Mesorhizobium sp. M2A.F.Ca.ET.046.02.1.1]
MVTELGQIVDIEKRGEMVKKLNNMLTDSYTIIPLVWLGGGPAISNTLGGPVSNPWDSALLGAQDWYRKK